MSRDVLKLLENMKTEEAEIQIALQCAPLLAGLKISNLLIVPGNLESEVEQTINNTFLEYELLFASEEKRMYLIYHPQLLERYVMKSEVVKAMEFFGYKEMQLSFVFQELSQRYAQYVCKAEGFPHELGLLLGYPVEDVFGFISNKGKNYLYTGYWKVYGNLTEKVELFHQYNQASDHVFKMLSQGNSLCYVLQYFYADNKRKLFFRKEYL